MPSMSSHRCEICGHAVFQRPGPGRPRERHDECNKLHEALAAVERAIDGARLQQISFSEDALIELRFRLLILSTEVPRPRDALGRFIRRRER